MTTPGKGIPAHWTTLQKLIWLQAIRNASGGAIQTVTGISPLALVNSLAKPLKSLTRYGKCEQRNPTPPPVLPDGYTELKTVRVTDANFHPTDEIAIKIPLPVDITTMAGKRLTVQNVTVSGVQQDAWYDGADTIPAELIDSTQQYGECTYGLGYRNEAPNHNICLGTGSYEMINLNVYLTAEQLDDVDFVYSLDGNLSPTVTIGSTPITVPSGSIYQVWDVEPDGENWLNILKASFNSPLMVGDIGRVVFDDPASGTVYADACPCIRNSDNAIGYYEIVGGTFHAAPAGMPLLAGDPVPAPVPADPSPDAPVDIWCNNGVLRANVNILDPTNVYGNYLLKDNGKIGNAAENFFLTNFIPVRPSTSYTFSFRSGADAQYRRLAEYTSADEDDFVKLTIKMPRPTAVDDVITRTFVTSPTTNYIRLSSSVLDTEQLIKLSDYALNEVYALGTPEDGVISADGAADQHFTVADLLGVGAYSNAHEITTGIKTGRVAAYVLTGDESWIKSGNVFASSTALPNKMRGKSQMLCTHFAYSSEASTGVSNGEFGCASTSTNTYFRYNALSTLDEFVAFLKAQMAAGTPVIVIYPLAESTTEQLTPQPLTTARGTTTITSSSPVEAKMTAEYWAKN